MRQRELIEFRTPQHPALGTNYWGGASPLLARDIPKESLEQRYLRLNSIRTRDEIFPAAAADDLKHYFPDHHQAYYAPKYEVPPTPSRREILSKLFRKKEKVCLGSNSRKKRWLSFPKWDPKHRWPQGWC